MAASRDDSSGLSFLDLPAEIRNHIYCDALVEPIDPVLLKPDAPFIVEPALLRTSKQLRSEALPIFYGANTFESPGRSAFVHFLRNFNPSKAVLLRNVHAFSPQDIADLQAELTSPEVVFEWVWCRLETGTDWPLFWRSLLLTCVRSMLENVLSEAPETGVRTSVMRLPVFNAVWGEDWYVCWKCIEEYDRVELRRSEGKNVHVEKDGNRGFKMMSKSRRLHEGVERGVGGARDVTH